MRTLRIAVLFISLMVAWSWALSVTKSRSSNMPCYKVTWKDQQNKDRIAFLVDTTSNWGGVIVELSYYGEDNVLNSVMPGTANSDPLNGAFGSTTHHASGSHKSSGTVTQRFLGASMAIYDFYQVIDGTKEWVTYTFQDGHDYFQWAQTDDVSAGTVAGDSRGPYCTMKWNVTGNQVQNIDFGAKKLFVNNPFWGVWTFGGTCDVPYCREQGDNKEIGYIQTQTFTQQLAGVPSFSDQLAASGSAWDGNETWKLDYQMAYYDGWLKCTWGLPYGYMQANGGAAVGQKSNWGQYSLSIVFDTKNQNGVYRVWYENKAIHSGKVSFTAATGTVKTQGPVGTKNPATQTLSPVGWDHNYRAWWVTAAGNNIDVNLNITGTDSLVAPVFRISGASDVPSTVTLNGASLTTGSDYFGSFDATNSEAWVCIVKTLKANNNITMGTVNTSGLTIANFTANPATIVNDVSNQVAFSATVTATAGSVSGVTLDLSALGGGTNVAMTGSGSNYSSTYTVPANTAAGSKTVTLKASNSNGGTRNSVTTVTVNTPAPLETLIPIYTDNATTGYGIGWVNDGANNVSTASEVSTGAFEGTKCIDFTYTTGGSYAGMGIAFNNWNSTVDASGATKLRVALKGAPGTSVTVSLAYKDTTVIKNVSLTAAATTAWQSFDLVIPSRSAGAGLNSINFVVAGAQTGAHLYIDAVYLVIGGATMRLPEKGIVLPGIGQGYSFIPKANGVVTVALFSLNGSLITKQVVPVIAGRSYLLDKDAMVKNNRSLTRGTYVIRADGAGVTHHERIIR